MNSNPLPRSVKASKPNIELVATLGSLSRLLMMVDAATRDALSAQLTVFAIAPDSKRIAAAIADRFAVALQTCPQVNRMPLTPTNVFRLLPRGAVG